MNMEANKPFQDADRNTHETVIALLSGEPPGKLFDAPAGEGALAEALAQAGKGARISFLFTARHTVAAIDRTVEVLARQAGRLRIGATRFRGASVGL